MTIVFSPLAPFTVLAVIAFIAIGASCISLWRNWRSGIFRFIGATALIALLANPQLREQEQDPLNDIAIILIDESASQRLGRREDQTANVVRNLQQKLSAYEDMDVRVVRFGSETQTHINAAVADAIADAPHAQLAGVFVITDGQTSDNDEPLRASDVSAPVHFIVTGEPDDIDRKITLTTAPRYGIIDQPVKVAFRIDDISGDGEMDTSQSSAEVTLRVDGDIVLSEQVPLGVDTSFNAPLSRPGDTIIELSVAEHENELTIRNNKAVLPISSIRDRLRVLLISGEPHPGERVWRNLLKSDPAVDLVHFTILRPLDKNDGTPVSELALIRFPRDELFIDKLDEFDLLIFDRYTYRAVLNNFHFDNITQYVQDGGAVLIAAGPEYNGPQSLASQQNLSFILPAFPDGAAIEGAFRPAISELGKKHPVTENLPDTDFWGRWLRVMPVNTPEGQILMTGPDNTPLLVLNRLEEGRVGLLLSDQVWLWARGFDGGGPHAELLRRIAHWLMKEPELEEEALRLKAQGDQLRVERRTVKTDTASVSIERPDGTSQEVALTPDENGLYSATIDAEEQGLYRARSEELFAIAAVGVAAPREYQNVVSTTKDVFQIAQSSGGGVFRNSGGLPDIRRTSQRAGSNSGPNWAGLPRRRAAETKFVTETPLAPFWAWFLIIAGALFAAWLIESDRLSRR